MTNGTERPKRRPSIEVRCPKCGTRTVWHRLPRAGDTALVLVMPAGCVVLGIIG